MMSAADTRARVIEIVRTISASKSVAPSERIFQDLSISGHDASDLLDELQREFGTSFAGLDFQAYFPDEGDGMLYGLLFNRLGWFKKKSMTVEHLVAVVLAGQWFEPPPPTAPET
jgi:hypothetical protein